MFRLPLVSLAALFFMGCGPTAALRRSTEAFYRDQTPAALNQLQQASISSKERYLAAMEKAVMLQQLGEYQASNRELIGCSKALDDRIASASQEAVALLSSDYFKTYTGEIFERVYLHTLALANFLALGDAEGAMVEAKRALKTLKTYTCSQCDFAFTYYLIALAFEANGEFDSAYLAARQAAAPNSRLADDAEETGAQLEGQDPLFPWSSAPRGRLVFGLFFLGAAPSKSEDYLFIPGTGGVAMPRFVPSPQHCQAVRLRIDEQESAGELIQEDLEQLAQASLEARQAALIAKAAARIAVQEGLEHVAEKQGNDLHKLAANGLIDLAFMLTNRADLRHWATLPNRSQLLSLVLPEGAKELEIEYLDHRGATLERETLRLNPRSEPLFLVRRKP